MKHHASLINSFCNRFQREYLYALRERDKWTRNICKVNVNDVVLIKDNNPRVLWKMALVIAVHKGRDGHIRAVTVRTASGNCFKRPVKLLFPIECSSNVDNSAEVINSFQDKPIINQNMRQAAINARKQWQRK